MKRNVPASVKKRERVGPKSTQAIAPKAYRLPEAAQALRISERALRNLIASGALRYVRLERVTKDGVKLRGDKIIPAAAIDEYLSGTAQ